MKKILLSASLIVAVAVAVVGATTAFFSDTETSTGNTFTAGAIDLLIDNSSYGFDWNNPQAIDPSGVWGPNPNNSWTLSDLDGELFFSFRDLKPGDYGEDTISIHVNNNDAWACMALDLKGTPENGQNEPEAQVDATIGPDEGELQNYLSFLFWFDDGDNVLEVGENLIQGLNGLSGQIFNGNWLPIAQAGNAPLEGGATNHIGKGWCFGDILAVPAIAGVNPNGPTPGNTGFTCSGAGNHNVAQTDGIVVDVSFYAVQSRNNESFLCNSLNPTPTPVQTGTLRVVKSITGIDNGATFDDFSFKVDGGASVFFDVDGIIDIPLAPGDYDVLEDVSGLLGYDVPTYTNDENVNLDCVDLTVTSGNTVTCTITNNGIEIAN